MIASLLPRPAARIIKLRPYTEGRGRGWGEGRGRGRGRGWGRGRGIVREKDGIGWTASEREGVEGCVCEGERGVGGVVERF